MGVGAVVQSSLYKPLAEHDNESISKIVVSAGKFFGKLALCLLVYVGVLVVVFPEISNTNTAFDSQYVRTLIVAISLSSFAQFYFGVVDRLILNAENPAKYQLGLSDNSFVVAIERDPVDHAVTVPLTANTSTPEVFTVPASVTFEAGQTYAEITVGFNNAEAFTDYQIEIAVDEGLTYQYAEQYVYPRFAATVLQEDYKVVHTGVYYNVFYF